MFTYMTFQMSRTVVLMFHIIQINFDIKRIYIRDFQRIKRSHNAQSTWMNALTHLNRYNFLYLCYSAR